MFLSIIGNLVADSFASFGLLTPAEVIAASAVLTVTLGGLAVLGWLTNERNAVLSSKSGPQPSFKKAA
jgi:hypothetical protein